MQKKKHKLILPKKQVGGVIEDPAGQWAYPGRVTRIPGTDITMQGVNYPVLGVSDTGHTQMMLPGKDYKFHGNHVTEYPQQSIGKSQTASGGLGNGGKLTYAGSGDIQKSRPVFDPEDASTSRQFGGNVTTANMKKKLRMAQNGTGLSGPVLRSGPNVKNSAPPNSTVTKAPPTGNFVNSTFPMQSGGHVGYNWQTPQWEIVDEMQSGGRTPIYTSNPNDPRLRAYNDSLELYNSHPLPKDLWKYDRINHYLDVRNEYKTIGKNENNEDIVETIQGDGSKAPIKPVGHLMLQSQYEKINPTNKVTQNGTHIFEGASLLDIYKKPVQPIVYKKPATIDSIDIGKPQQITQEDNRQLETIDNQPSQMVMPRGNKVFSRPRQSSESGSSSFPDRVTPQVDYFDARTGKPVTMRSGGVVTWEIV